MDEALTKLNARLTDDRPSQFFRKENLFEAMAEAGVGGEDES